MGYISARLCVSVCERVYVTRLVLNLYGVQEGEYCLRNVITQDSNTQPFEETISTDLRNKYSSILFQDNY